MNESSKDLGTPFPTEKTTLLNRKRGRFIRFIIINKARLYIDYSASQVSLTLVKLCFFHPFGVAQDSKNHTLVGMELTYPLHDQGAFEIF